MRHVFARRDFVLRVLILLIACLIGPAAFAATADDIGAAQSIIRAQEEAFARDDAPTAYSFAAPGIQSFYRSPDGFMYMVRNSYAPVYRHRSFVFGEARIVDGKIQQEVQIVDARRRRLGRALYARNASRRQPQDFRLHLEESGDLLEHDPEE
jgi:hypothetical protein